MADEPKKMSAAEFRALGYLQELNRCYLHPLGLALEVTTDNDGHVTGFGDVWDYRDDPEGMNYGPDMINTEKTLRINKELQDKAVTRVKKLGYFIQPPG